MVVPDGISRWYEAYMPTAPQAAPRPVDSQSIRLKESLSMRATTAGMTSVAATSVTPMMLSVARIDTDSTSMSSASMRATRTPDTSATSGSNVENRNAR